MRSHDWVATLLVERLADGWLDDRGRGERTGKQAARRGKGLAACVSLFVLGTWGGAAVDLRRGHEAPCHSLHVTASMSQHVTV
jgi:hypothetical protein